MLHPATQIRSGIVIWSFDSPDKPAARPLFLSQGFSIAPRHIAWCPDGKKMAFEAWRLKGEGERELMGIAVMDITSTQPVAVDAATASQVPIMIPADESGKPQNPRWSPDGSRILYEMARPSGTDLWVMNADGTNRINLTHGVGYNTQGVWAPMPK